MNHNFHHPNNKLKPQTMYEKRDWRLCIFDHCYYMTHHDGYAVHIKYNYNEYYVVWSHHYINSPMIRGGWHHMTKILNLTEYFMTQRTPQSSSSLKNMHHIFNQLRKHLELSEEKSMSKTGPQKEARKAYMLYQSIKNGFVKIAQFLCCWGCYKKKSEPAPCHPKSQ